MAINNGPLMDFITGLSVTKTSATSYTVASGGAAIPSLNRVIVSEDPRMMPVSELTASATYYIYLYWQETSGASLVEHVTTAPTVNPYFGTAKNKQGDTSRRWIGSFTTNAAGEIDVVTGLPDDRYATASQGALADTAVQPDATASVQVKTVWTGTQAQYDAITSPAATTLYIING